MYCYFCHVQDIANLNLIHCLALFFLQFPNNVIIVKTKCLLPQVQMTLANFGYPV